MDDAARDQITLAYLKQRDNYARVADIVRALIEDDDECRVEGTGRGGSPRRAQGCVPRRGEGHCETVQVVPASAASERTLRIARAAKGGGG